MNWGWKIFFLYLGFATMILTLVILSSREKIELVTTDYYKKEIAYQGIIEANQNAINDHQQSTFDVTNNVVTISFPNASENQMKSIQVYSVSSSANDQHLETTSSTATIPLTAGKYSLQIEWSFNGKNYFEEKTLQIK
jgi:hypothetical protein